MPTHTRHLFLPGRMLLWAMRHWVLARRDQRPLPGYVRVALSELPDGAALLRELDRLLAIVALGARRRLWITQPACQALTGDERTLLGALLACHQGLLPEARLALADLMGRRGLDPAVTASERLAGCLRQAGLRLQPHALEGCGVPESLLPVV